ncbi:LamG domain-containing protein [Myxococcota bacterium]|nr:LamG domain-containing protein [Myxococcota bacterium]
MNFDNRPCGDGCLEGYSCNEQSGLCEKNATACTGNECDEPCVGDLCNCLFTEGGMEICDNLDNDCDGKTDNEALNCDNYYKDADNDGFGDENDYQCLCAPTELYTVAEDPDCTTDCFDCDDTNFACKNDCSDLDDDTIMDCADSCMDFDYDDYGIGPGCEDSDCDDTNDSISACANYYTDKDNDGYRTTNDLCLCPSELIDNPDYIHTEDVAVDCDDDDDTINSGATELCDGVDNNCDTDLPNNETDQDDDGWIGCNNFSRNPNTPSDILGGDDCAPTDPAIHPGLVDFSDNVDNDCDGFTDDCIYSCPCGDSTLMACYMFEGNALDSSGNGNDLTSSGSGTSITSGQDDNKTYLNGSDSYYLTDTSGISVDGPFSFALEIETRDTLPDGNSDDERDGLVDNDGNYGLFIKPPTSGGIDHPYFQCIVGSHTAGNDGITTAATGTTYHLACTYDGRQLRIYINGALKDTSAAHEALPPTPTGVFALGSNAENSNNPPVSQYFKGYMDQALFFSRLLSPTEVCALSGRTVCLAYRVE